MFNLLTYMMNHLNEVHYLKTRGWVYDDSGWWQKFNPNIPPNQPFHHCNRETQKKNITMEEALYYAKMSDMRINEPLTPPKSLGIDPNDDVWV